MTLQLRSPSLVAATLERRSFWRRLIDAIEASQRRKAEQVITAYLRRYRGERHDELTRVDALTEAGISELLRRPLVSTELAAALARCLRSPGGSCSPR